MIEFKGSHTVPRSPEQLWPILQDPEVLKKCIPGCEELTRNGDHLYAMRLKVGLGMIKGSFQGTVQVTDIVEPESYALDIKADGKTGFARGKIFIRLAPAVRPGSTELHFESRIQVGG